ncbi:hypothetical protein FVEG_06507 [Fusarium verticillioides 7600]|uniref:Transcription factor domain-containing protein n=1 Tax=Gibberella moniliformis (strain M3125 / FGSC 7600) TaxID=334819 RepID=W7ME24_GIBM7|nr:hypothetical protein FVEG_06507 [Fusarium verticillioides 7600]EWG45859.1 hypothetical protein FVEG_06507 [Fusarium verticillioides 7600]
MLEGLYHINSGNLKSGWLASRRAISIGKLFDLPLRSQRSSTIYEPSHLKSRLLLSRLNYANRFLSLMLGVPSAAIDCIVASNVISAESPLERLEQLHAVIMGRVISRNQRIAAADPTQALQSELMDTKSLDQELRRIASLLPEERWLPSHLREFVADMSTSEAFGLLAQVNHIHLLLILHLPYVLQSLSSLQPGDADSLYKAVTASRDILSRFILCRKFNQISTRCHAVDFKALTASATLLIEHLVHPLGHSALAHQRLQDVGLVQMAIRSIESIVKSSLDSQGETELRVLKWLQAADANAGNGVLHMLCISESKSQGECCIFEEGLNLESSAPYLGRLRVNRVEESREGTETLLSERLGISDAGSGGYRAWHFHNMDRMVLSLIGIADIHTMCHRVGEDRSQSDTSPAARMSHEVLVPGSYTDSNTWGFQDLVSSEFSEC